MRTALFLCSVFFLAPVSYGAPAPVGSLVIPVPGVPLAMPEAPKSRVPMEKEAVARFAAVLVEDTYRPQPAIEDRASWAELAKTTEIQRVFVQALADLKETSPVLTPELFEAFNTTGDRRGYETAFRKRSERLAHFTLAECVEAKGHFLPAIEKELALILAENTWAVPAHWYPRKGPDGVMVLDLAAAARGSLLAVVDAWLGNRLQAPTRAAIRHEVSRRVLQPYLEAARTGRVGSGVSWMTAVNNWNAVCHAGVLVSALTLIESRQTRAEFLAGAEAYLPIYLRDGFTAEGYSTEGPAYWNYGFGAYIELCQAVKTATAGRVDWMQGERIRSIAAYPARLAITPGVYPSFSDNAPGVKFSPWALDSIERQLNLGQPAWRQRDIPAPLPLYHGLGATLHRVAITLGADRTQENQAPVPTAALRDEFAEAQVFILRAGGDQAPFGLAFKGGHNGELHNHNDLGSYIIAVNGATPILDPGMEIYTKRTFSPQRYESRVISSYGHPVPLVAGREQSTGERFAAQVVRRVWTADHDEVTLDLKGGYEVAELQSLERTFSLQRGLRPLVQIIDNVHFSSPQSFATALVTLGEFERINDRTVRVRDGGQTVEVTIDAAGKSYRLNEELLPETLPNNKKARRLGITLDEPVSEARVILTLEPVAQ